MPRSSNPRGPLFSVRATGTSGRQVVEKGESTYSSLAGEGVFIVSKVSSRCISARYGVFVPATWEKSSSNRAEKITASIIVDCEAAVDPRGKGSECSPTIRIHTDICTRVTRPNYDIFPTRFSLLSAPPLKILLQAGGYRHARFKPRTPPLCSIPTSEEYSYRQWARRPRSIENPLSGHVSQSSKLGKQMQKNR